MSWHAMFHNEGEPQTATIIPIKSNNKLDVQWMHGSYSDPWLLCKCRRTTEQWIEEIQTTDLLYPIELTRTNRLSESLMYTITSLYQQLEPG